MARTKTILVPVGTAAGDGTTGSSANTGPPGVQETLRVRAQDGDGSDLDGNNAPQDREATPEQDDEGGAARRDTTGPAMMTTLTTVLQQLVTSTDRMEARMHVIETQRSTAAIGSSATSGPPETTTGRTQDTSARSEPAPATTLTATMQRGPAPTVFGRRGGHGDDPDGGDGSDDSADSSSGDERATGPTDLATGTTMEELDLAHFSNPQGVWNKFTGTWDIPVGRQWNGRYWAKKSMKRDRPARAT
ncbi:hypothetical protein PF002_g8811 [Phytophthora fragariae]|uniref:Uncharacterized protein n=1 Tax=Phytophthora fragariae TaxID=53985 RepID=A0A6A3ZTF1_9STRA|nr:hypothetical protein PF002_g8811 [Phytophthora fragariae]